MKNGNEELLSIKRCNGWNAVHDPVDNLGQAMDLPSQNEYQVRTSGEQEWRGLRSTTTGSTGWRP